LAVAGIAHGVHLQPRLGRDQYCLTQPHGSPAPEGGPLQSVKSRRGVGGESGPPPTASPTGPEEKVREMDSTKIKRKDQAAIIARLKDAGIDARKHSSFGTHSVVSNEINMHWREGAWHCSYHPGLYLVVRTWEELDEIVRVATAEIPEDVLEVVLDIIHLFGELEGSVVNISDQVESAVRHLSGCPRDYDEVARNGCAGDLASYAENIDYLIDSVREHLDGKAARASSPISVT
jgi:hypothetical protein